MKIRAHVYLTITGLCEISPALCKLRVEAKETFQISDSRAEAEEIVEYLNLLLKFVGQ